MPSNILALELKLELSKKRLTNMAIRFGPDHPKVIKLSQQMDKLVVELMRRKANEARPETYVSAKAAHCSV